MMKMQWKCLALTVLMAATNPVLGTENFGVEKKLQFMMLDKVVFTNLMPYISSVTDYNKMRKNPIPWLKQREQQKVIEYLQKNNIKELPELEFDTQELRFKLGQYNVKASVADYYNERFNINGEVVNLKGKNLDEKMKLIDTALSKVESVGRSSFSLISSAYADNSSAVKQYLLMGMVVLNIDSVSKNAEIQDGLKVALTNISNMDRSCNKSPVDMAKVDALWKKIEQISSDPKIFTNAIEKKFLGDKKMSEADVNMLKTFNALISGSPGSCASGLKMMVAKYSIPNADDKYINDVCTSFISLNNCLIRLLGQNKISDARRSDTKDVVAAEDTMIKSQGGAVKAQ